MRKGVDQMSNHVMGSKPIPKLITSLAGPAIIAQFINILYNIVDRIYVGHIPEVGSLALTGIGVSAPLLLLISAFSALVAGGAAPLAAMALGRKDKQEAEKIMGTALALLILMGIVLMLVSYYFLDDLLILFGASDNSFPFARDYAFIYLIGTIFVMLSLGMNQFISCQGQAKIAMYAVLIGAITNIILDPILIFTFNMGIQGAAIATVISQGFSAFYVMRFLLSNQTQIKLRKDYIHLDKSLIRSIVALGISTFIMQATESAINIVFNTQLLKYGGDLHVGAITIMQSVMQFVTIPLGGYVQGVQPIVSFNFGAKKFERVKETIRITLISLTSVTIVYYGLIAAVPQLFAKVFTSDTELIAIVRSVLPSFMLGISLFSIQMTAQMFFVGTGQAKTSLFIAMFRKVILLIPLAFILPNFYGVRGIYYAEPISDLTSILVCSFLLYIGLKKVPNYD